MNKIPTIFLLALLVLSAHGSAKAQSEPAIETIRLHYGEINRKAPTYRKINKNLSGFSAEGGELAVYFQGASIMKIVATFFGEAGRTAEEYYYWDGKLIFVFRKESRYGKPLSGKVVSTAENRFYFANDKMIRWIDENRKKVPSDSEEYREKQGEYLKSSKELTEGALSRSSVIESNQER